MRGGGDISLSPSTPLHKMARVAPARFHRWGIYGNLLESPARQTLEFSVSRMMFVSLYVTAEGV